MISKGRPPLSPFVHLHQVLLTRPPGLFALGPLTYRLDGPGLCWVLGKNGCGKTTLLRTIAGLFTPDGGTLQVSSPLIFVSQEGALRRDSTVHQQLLFWQNLYEKGAREAADYFHLEPLLNKQIGELSEGERQRVSLSRLLMRPASVWLLDEPFRALDTENWERLSRLLVRHVDEKGIALVTSHHVIQELPALSWVLS